jgi:hypothetical protein
MNRHADSAHIVSEEVAAVTVLRTGVRDSKARNTRMDDLSVLAPDQGSRVSIEL